MIYRLKKLGGKYRMDKNRMVLRYLIIIFLGSVLIPVSGIGENPLAANPASFGQEDNEDSERKGSIEKDRQKASLSTTVEKSDVVFILPITSGRITAKYGKMMHPYKREIVFHRGIDIAAKYGTAVCAAASGTVLSATKEKEKGKGYGTHLILDHEDGFQTFYAHLDTILVKEGENIEAGKTVAKVGSSGLSTGPHLHFEIRQHDKHHDPEDYIDFTDIKQR
jgi:murein DD-endopeptidase MepM/ murein hydrolase activator NlpD